MLCVLAVWQSAEGARGGGGRVFIASRPLPYRAISSGPHPAGEAVNFRLWAVGAGVATAR